MKIIATIPSTAGYSPSFIIEADANDIASLVAAPSASGSITAKRKGQSYSILIKDLIAGDELDGTNSYNFRVRALNINDNADEIKKAISNLRGALTKLENITNAESKKETK